MSVQNRTVVVTGASRGIGAATARRLVQQGAKVGLIARDATALAALAAELGDRAMWTVGDITDEASITAAVDAVAAHFGRIDALVANAGINRHGTVVTLSGDDFEDVVRTNLVGTYRTIKAALPHLIESGGYITIVSSISSSIGLGGMGAYSASKAGTEMLAHTLRMELTHLGVSVGSIHPWFVDTELVAAGEDAMPSFADARRALTPLRHVPGPIGLAGTTLTVDQCAVMITRMVDKRIMRRHLPRSAGFLTFSRNVLNSGLGEFVQNLMFGQIMRRIEAETAPRPPLSSGAEATTSDVATSPDAATSLDAREPRHSGGLLDDVEAEAVNRA